MMVSAAYRRNYINVNYLVLAASRGETKVQVVSSLKSPSLIVSILSCSQFSTRNHFTPIQFEEDTKNYQKMHDGIGHCGIKGSSNFYFFYRKFYL